MASRAERSRDESSMGRTLFASNVVRYAAEVPKWVTLSDERSRGIERYEWGLKGEPE